MYLHIYNILYYIYIIRIIYSNTMNIIIRESTQYELIKIVTNAHLRIQ